MATGKWKIKIDPDDFGFGAVLVCAVRYCIGRQTYMPHTICGYIRGIFPALTDETLEAFIRDIEAHRKHGGSFGMYFDEEMWLKFLDDAKKEMEGRNGRV